MAISNKQPCREQNWSRGLALATSRTLKAQPVAHAGKFRRTDAIPQSHELAFHVRVRLVVVAGAFP